MVLRSFSVLFSCVYRRNIVIFIVLMVHQPLKPPLRQTLDTYPANPGHNPLSLFLTMLYSSGGFCPTSGFEEGDSVRGDFVRGIMSGGIL